MLNRSAMLGGRVEDYTEIDIIFCSYRHLLLSHRRPPLLQRRLHVLRCLAASDNRAVSRKLPAPRRLAPFLRVAAAAYAEAQPQA